MQTLIFYGNFQSQSLMGKLSRIYKSKNKIHIINGSELSALSRTVIIYKLYKPMWPKYIGHVGSAAFRDRNREVICFNITCQGIYFPISTLISNNKHCLAIHILNIFYAERQKSFILIDNGNHSVQFV